MKTVTMTLLAAAAIGGVFAAGSASAMPFNTLSPAEGESPVQDVRMVCDQRGRCYNTRRNYRSVRPHSVQRGYRYDRPAYYRGGPSYGYTSPNYGHYNRPGIGIGIGPAGVRVF